jgi:hypothetical protein
MKTVFVEAYVKLCAQQSMQTATLMHDTTPFFAYELPGSVPITDIRIITPFEVSDKCRLLTGEGIAAHIPGM